MRCAATVAVNTYYYSPTRNVTLANLQKMLPLPTIAPAVGLVELPGHENASCGGWPQCTNLTNRKCGCLNFLWNRSTLHEFVLQVEAAGMSELDVWRMDMTPPRGTVPAIPPWFIAELEGFISRGP